MTKACVICGRASEKPRCPEHRLPYRGWKQSQAKKQVIAEETVCAVCGEPGSMADPLEAGHIIPRSMGGTADRWNMRAEHRSCNARRGTQSVGGVVKL